MPIRSPKSSFSDEVTKVRRLCNEYGRDPSTLAITVMNAPQTSKELEALGDLGVDRAVFTVWPQDPDTVLSELDRIAAVMEEVSGV